MRIVTIPLLYLTTTASAAAQTVDSALARFCEARWWQPAWIEANSIGPDAEEVQPHRVLRLRRGSQP